MTHHIKISQPYADAILEGRKTFEVRLNDRGYNAGDRISFTVLSPSGLPVLHHDIADNLFEITYVHSGLGLKNGYVVFGIKKVL